MLYTRTSLSSNWEIKWLKIQNVANLLKLTKKETKCRLLFTCAGKVASGRDFKSWTETEKPAMSIANWRIRRKFNWTVKNYDKKQTNCKRNLIWQIKLWISILIWKRNSLLLHEQFWPAESIFEMGFSKENFSHFKTLVGNTFLHFQKM